MPARKYTPRILAYCERHGVEVPPPFQRHPASRFVVIRLDATPPKISAKTFFKKEDLHYYLRGKVAELGASDASALPLRVLDFKDEVLLIVEPDGRTRPGGPIDSPTTHAEQDQP